MLGDLEHTLLAAYDSLRPHRQYYGQHAGYHAFLIDKEGILRGVWYQGKDGGRPTPEEVLEAVPQ